MRTTRRGAAVGRASAGGLGSRAGRRRRRPGHGHQPLRERRRRDGASVLVDVDRVMDVLDDDLRRRRGPRDRGLERARGGRARRLRPEGRDQRQECRRREADAEDPPGRGRVAALRSLRGCGGGRRRRRHVVARRGVDRRDVRRVLRRRRRFRAARGGFARREAGQAGVEIGVVAHQRPLSGRSSIRRCPRAAVAGSSAASAGSACPSASPWVRPAATWWSWSEGSWGSAPRRWSA